MFERSEMKVLVFTSSSATLAFSIPLISFRMPRFSALFIYSLICNEFAFCKHFRGFFIIFLFQGLHTLPSSNQSSYFFSIHIDIYIHFHTIDIHHSHYLFRCSFCCFNGFIDTLPSMMPIPLVFFAFALIRFEKSLCQFNAFNF